MPYTIWIIGETEVKSNRGYSCNICVNNRYEDIKAQEKNGSL